MKMIAEIKNEDVDFKSYSYKVTELESKIGRRLDREYLKNTARSLMKKPLTIDEGEGDFLICNWISSFKYKSKEAEIEISFDPKLKPYLLQLQTHFVKADIRQIFQLTSEYAKRIYTIFKQWEKIGKYEIEVAEWQKILEVPKTQLMYGEFKRKVIQVAKEQINAKTDLDVDYEEIKKGRKITHLVWTIKNKKGKQTTIEDFTDEEIETGMELKGIDYDRFTVVLAKAIVEYIKFGTKETTEEAKKTCRHHGVLFSKKLLSDALKVAKEIQKSRE